jgi:hypothetical protein
MGFSFLAFRQFLDFNYSKNQIFKKFGMGLYGKELHERNSSCPRISGSRRRKVEHWIRIIL